MTKLSIKYSFSIGLLNTKHKPLVKKRSTGPVCDRSIGTDFEFYRLGRVEKILTGSISVLTHIYIASAIKDKSKVYARI